MSEEPVTFVRHGGTGFLDEQWSQEWLFGDENRPARIGIHYQDKASFASSDYDHRPRRIKRFEKAAVSPTIAVVAFSTKPKGEKYLARTIPNTREIVVMDIGNKEIVHVEEVRPEGSVEELTSRYEHDEKFKIAKTLRVEGWKRIAQEDHTVLWDWHVMDAIHDPSKNASEKSQYIRAAFHGDPKPVIIDSLNHRDDELMAEKYLRATLIDFTVDVPRGGNLDNIDLLGTAKDEDSGELKTVVASVTSSSKSHRRGRVEAINSFSDRDEVYFFDAESSQPQNLDPAVKHISLNKVYEWMDEDDSRRQRSLYTMLGLRDQV